MGSMPLETILCRIILFMAIQVAMRYVYLACMEWAYSQSLPFSFWIRPQCIRSIHTALYLFAATTNCLLKAAVFECFMSA